MTEYDYSPDAYERYIATQRRIARWVDSTSRYPPSNPFFDSPTTSPRVPESSTRSSSPSRTTSPPLERQHSGPPTRSSPEPIRRRPVIPRSQTAPAPTHRCSTQRSRSSHPASPTSRSPRSSSRHTGGTTDSSITAASYKTITPNKHSPTYVVPSGTQPILVPIDGGRGGYIIVPPTGTRMEVLNPSSSSYAISSPDSQRARSRETAKRGKPFVKRLFSSFTSSGGR